jgi:hypothetical protein
MSILFNNDVSTTSFICESPILFLCVVGFFRSGLCITWTDYVTFMKLAVVPVTSSDWEAGMA